MVACKFLLEIKCGLILEIPNKICFFTIVLYDLFKVFEIGSEDGKLVGKSTARHCYILHPVSGDAKYTKVPADGTRNIGEPALKAAINLDDVTLCLSKVIFPLYTFYASC